MIRDKIQLHVQAVLGDAFQAELLALLPFRVYVQVGLQTAGVDAVLKSATAIKVALFRRRYFYYCNPDHEVVAAFRLVEDVHGNYLSCT